MREANAAICDATGWEEYYSPESDSALPGLPYRFDFEDLSDLAAVGITVRGVKEWDTKPIPALPARLAGGLSLALWVLVVIFGRWTGFTVMK